MLYLTIPVFFTIFFLFFHKNAQILKLIDKPNERKLHKGDVPLIGGIVIYLTIISSSLLIINNFYINVIIYSSTIVLLVGIIDDARDLSVSVRLFSQFIATLIILGSGLSIVDIGDYYIFDPFNLGTFGLLLTFISVIGLTNAFNFIDGINGLCSGLITIGFCQTRELKYPPTDIDDHSF